MNRTSILLLLSAVLLALPACGQERKGLPIKPRETKLKVFLLVGQSNMEGKGKLDHLKQLATSSDKETRARYGHLVDGDGNWTSRKDVWISYFDRFGDLTAGYGTPVDRFGPELQFGHVVGDAFEQQVLLLKVAWGGRSLAKDFRPPSAGGETGASYTEMLREVKRVLGSLKRHFPAYDGRGFEIAGLAWFQGWNDRVNQAANDEYAVNLPHFIRDVRKALERPRLPVVIGETGQGGPEEKHPRALSLMRHQAAVAAMPEWDGTVALAETKHFYRSEPRFDGGYHFFGNAENFFDIGDALGRKMVELSKPKLEVATFGNGCFWCTEAVMEQQDGVVDAVSGYMGGHVDNPTYEQICTKTTGHHEVVQVTYDPEKISYGTLLKWFWKSHDPTSKDQQGADKGPQYRSVIFTHTPGQKKQAEDAIARLTKEGVYLRPIVTEIHDAQSHPFWKAEAEHQDFYKRNPNYGYCRVVIAPKLDKLGLDK